MKLSPIFLVLGLFLLGPPLWRILGEPRSGAERLIEARERAERVAAVGELPWEKPNWRDEFHWKRTAPSRLDAVELPLDEPAEQAAEPEQHLEPQPVAAAETSRTIPQPTEAETHPGPRTELPTPVAASESEVAVPESTGEASSPTARIPAAQEASATSVEVVQEPPTAPPPPLVACRLRLVDRAGRPVRGRSLRVHTTQDAEAFELERITDEGGWCELELPAGEFWVASGTVRKPIRMREGLTELELAVD